MTMTIPKDTVSDLDSDMVHQRMVSLFQSPRQDPHFKHQTSLPQEPRDMGTPSNRTYPTRQIISIQQKVKSSTQNKASK